MDLSHPQSRTALLESLVASAPDALLVIDAAGRIVLANRTAHSLFGCAENALLDTHIEELIPQRLRQTHVQHRLYYAQHPRTREMGAALADLVARRADGLEFPVEIRLSPIDVDGEQLFAAAVRDVTDRRQTAQALRVAQDEASRANAAKSRFLATASHDLRQPVQTLRLLNAALRRQIEDPSALDVLNRECAALDSMAGLLNALLDISKLESGNVHPEIENVDVAEILQTLRRESEPEAAVRGLSLTAQAASQDIQTDRTLFRQLMGNLLTNAIKYTNTGTVTLRTSARAGGLAISVADTGVGIPAEQLDSIFDEFYQVDPKSGRRGVGLGLAIVKRIANLLGLAIEVESSAGRGSEFRVIVPAAQVVGSARATPARAAPPNQPSMPTGGVVLLVEDDEAVRTATQLYLKAIGYTTIAADSLEQLERVLSEGGREPDLIISDYHLGETTTGIDVIHAVRSRTGKLLPALLLSGDTSTVLRKLADVPACRLLSKPVDVEELGGVLAELLRAANRV